ncbi:hypothetical protein E8E12_000887 [Didymella heteroderae]|uniref:Uncharacterized protein n=1 Tax=Didymella heteroderae TaxID=1769908 RepID=A0A9P5BV78_9PLEO|nr:hypothetical protein E8E12_000887 [Didymella heteroderae]
MDSQITVEDPELYKEFREVRRENGQTRTNHEQPENAHEQYGKVMHKALEIPGSPAVDTWSAISENSILPDEDMALCSYAVELTAKFLNEEAFEPMGRTYQMKITQTTETGRKDETITDDLEADANSNHKQDPATVSPQRLLAKQKRRAHTRSAQRKAQQQRKRR